MFQVIGTALYVDCSEVGPELNPKELPVEVGNTSLCGFSLQMKYKWLFYFYIESFSPFVMLLSKVASLHIFEGQEVQGR